MLRGLTTVSFFADDLAAAAGTGTPSCSAIEPYFARPVDGPPAYVEFRIGDYQHELGIIDRRYAPARRGGHGPGGAVIYWHVDDVAATVERLLAMGATEHQPITHTGTARLRHRVGGRPVRQHPRHHVQPALPRRARRQDHGVTADAHVPSRRTARSGGPWLRDNGDTADEMWLVIHHGDSATPSVRHHEAIEQALCFGWIDSLARKRDAESWCQRFTPRNPRSAWSKVNRELVDRLTAQGLMTPHGQAAVDLAKRTGTWSCSPTRRTA